MLNRGRGRDLWLADGFARPPLAEGSFYLATRYLIKKRGHCFTKTRNTVYDYKGHAKKLTSAPLTYLKTDRLSIESQRLDNRLLYMGRQVSSVYRIDFCQTKKFPLRQKFNSVDNIAFCQTKYFLSTNEVMR